MFLTVSLFCAFALLIILYPNRSVGVSARNNIPGPSGLPCIGNLLQVFPYRRRMISFMELLNKVYGPLSTFTIPGWGRLVVINRPEWLAHVKKNDISMYTRGPVAVSIFEQFPGLGTPVASEGEKWRASRKAIQPIFGVKSFQDHLATAMSDLMPTTTRFLANAAKDQLPFDWNDFSGRLALSIFVKSNFNLDTTMLQEDPKALTDSHELISSICELNEISAARLFNPYWYITEKLDGTWFRFRRTISVLWKTIDGLIEERSKSLALAGDVDSQETDFFSTFLKSHSETDPIFTRNIMVTLLFGGRDNTQNSISWALYELSRQPEWLNRMREEAIALGQSGQHPTFATLPSYVIHLAVFYETVRLWPGLPKNARYATVDDILPAVPELSIPETNIEKGTYVLWSDKIIMRDPLVWGPDADEFNPGRHISDDGKFVKPSAPEFITFGAGPRYCPAASIVPYEWVFIWSTLLRLFDFEFLDTSKRTTGDFLTNQMADPFMVRVREREA
ncbi:cytochrome P450 [Guyanagaster necrorhizus]|uniref:Cytochrome P450 n=1 Tax=Guyanagaster necrorhizus TaxID=856835 RepID=A0A9P8AUN0_9AGAR|nr:cytochrome P450 [Guyanagaster necrorhizus MCA 3950]KAG7447082.1 cytochrome P450 [Guyanagaster necrorhizus MCA 3950]